jgi:cell wall-associated NlpC family hydrolase
VSIVAIVDKTLSANGAYGAGAVAASNTDHVSIKATSSAGGTQFNDRAAAGSQFSNLISMPAYTGGLSALFLYAATTAGARLLYSEGTEASIAAAVENTHAASRIVMGATRQAAGTPSSFGGARLRASIVINKVLSATERNNLRTYYSIA